MAKLVRAIGVATALSLGTASVANAAPSADDLADAPTPTSDAAPADSAAAAAPAQLALPWQPGPRPIALGHGIKLA